MLRGPTESPLYPRKRTSSAQERFGLKKPTSDVRLAPESGRKWAWRWRSEVDPKQKSAVSEEAEHWSLTTLREKLIRTDARMVRHDRYVAFWMAEVAVLGRMFEQILAHVARLRAPPVPA